MLLYNIVVDLIGFPPIHVHHVHYGTVTRERDKDLALLCGSCHRNVHYVGDERLPLTKAVLVTRFKELKERNK